MFQISKTLVKDIKEDCVKNKKYIEAHYLRKLEKSIVDKDNFIINSEDFNNYKEYINFNTLFTSVIISLN